MDDLTNIALIITNCREEERSSSYTAERILVALGLRTENIPEWNTLSDESIKLFEEIEAGLRRSKGPFIFWG